MVYSLYSATKGPNHPYSGLGPALGGSDLTFSLVLRQIRLATPLAPRSVGVKAADQECYSGRNALAVRLQTDRESVKAFEQDRDPKTAALQQRRQADGSQLGARADDGGTVALCLPTPGLIPR